MQFYKIHGVLHRAETTESDRRAKRDFAYKVASKTVEFNGLNNKEYCFLADANDDYVIFGLIASRPMNRLTFVRDYAKAIDLEPELSPPEEITLLNMQNLLLSSGRQYFLEDTDEVMSRFNLDRLQRRRGIEFGENLINYKATREELFSSAKQFFMNDTLLPELERIYSGTKSMSVYGHPVHYIVETDDRDLRREAYKVLLDALYANNRLGSCRYSFLDFRNGESYSQLAFETLYKVSEGGAVVVRYLSNDEPDGDSYATGERETILNICETAKRYRNSVLTVICFPRECKKVKNIFYENLGTMSFVEIREDFIRGGEAKVFLTDLAKKSRIRTDKKLFSEIKEERVYLAPELQEVFDEWYNGKLKTTLYPQYKEFATAQKEVVKAKPKGSAYEELSEMIGLTEAKEVIKKALNYYKMQKLYQEKGVKSDNPAMHMIFTGNPGTAKTTVARLFARIMKENGLISKGQLVEVGRGNLVGKYVGWTAQTVQQKFAEASGGVLFIDEAYSLVDGREGSYGDEAINTIVQEMENHREDVVVIFAGYPDKMEGFIEKNPGLRSRIAFHVPFADYTSEELCMIARLIGKRGGVRFEPEAMDKLSLAFDAARKNVDFGNGRYVRNLFEQSKMNQATRLLRKDFDEITTDDVITITAEDIVIPDNKRCDTRRAGFC